MTWECLPTDYGIDVWDKSGPGARLVACLGTAGWLDDHLKLGNEYYVPTRIRDDAEKLHREFFPTDPILPCPLCGKDSATQDSSSGAHEVCCGNCPAYTWGETPLQAIRAWNRRAPKSIIEFQQAVGRWLVECFGERIARDKKERATRLVEEALELAQALEVSKESMHRLVDYVYARPVGSVPQELAGCLITLSAAAASFGESLEDAGVSELHRIQKPKVMERIREKQAQKRVEGVSEKV